MNTTTTFAEVVSNLPIVILVRALREAFGGRERGFAGLPARA